MFWLRTRSELKYVDSKTKLMKDRNELLAQVDRLNRTIAESKQQVRQGDKDTFGDTHRPPRPSGPRRMKGYGKGFGKSS